MLYVKHKTWTADGSREVIHVYDVDHNDKHLTHRGTYSSDMEVEFRGFSKAVDLITFLNRRA